jgi:hypothetical protein
METAYDLQIRALEIDGLLKLRRGQYESAEELFAQQYELLLEMQKDIRIRVPKGAPLHNIGIAELFQGKTSQSIRHLLLAYIEDLISSSAPFDADTAPASRTLRGLCGATWDDLVPLEDYVFSAKVRETPPTPESIYDAIPDAGSKIQKNYEDYLGTTWKLEIQGQRLIETKVFEKARKAYVSWYEALLRYQESRGARVHKGHPLHNAGFATVNLDVKEALNYFLLAYIEDVLSERREGQARSTPAFKTLTTGYGISQKTIEDLENWVRTRKQAKIRQFDPGDELESFKTRKVRMPGEIVELRLGDTLMITHTVTATGSLQAAPRAKRSIDDLPGTYSSRVFIGGSYANENTLHEIEEYVKECGLTGIVAIDYESPVDDDAKLLNIHDLDVLLIHMSRYAIFELSFPGAQYGEIEWAIRFLNKPTYGVKSERSPSVSPHIADLFREEAKREVFTYSRNEELRKYIVSAFTTS